MLTTVLAILAIQSQAQTETVMVSPKFRDGVHFACEASFDVYVVDTAYFRGQPVAVSGSFTFYNWPDQSRVFVGMKLGVLAVDNGGWRPPANAYVVNGYRTNLSEQQANIEAEDPNFRLFVFDFAGEETMKALLRMSDERRLDVAYTMEGGSMPTTFPVALTDEQALQWADCTSALASRDQQ
jgi:hypothetical protein